MKKFIIMIVMVLCFASISYAEEFDLRGGYNLSINASTNNDRVEVSGRIRGGENCANLRLDIFAYNDQGNIANIVTAVENVGGSGSKIIEGSDTLIFKPKGNWKVRSVYASCVKK